MKRTLITSGLFCLALVYGVFVYGQVPTVPNSDFPTFRSNLNTSLQKAANITLTYANPAWITSLAWTKITGAPSTLGPTGPTGPSGAAGANGPTGPTGPSGSLTTCSLSSNTTKACTHSLTTSTPVWACYDASGNQLGGATASTSVTNAVATSSSVLTFTFSGSTTGTCLISTGGAGAAGPTGPTGPTGASGSGTGTINSSDNPKIAQYVGSSSVTVGGVTVSGDATMANGGALTLSAPQKIRSCVVVVGDPGAASGVLANDNDSPVSCGNTFGADWTIQTVGCWADAGTPTITPILTGGSGTSVLAGALTCGTASWAGAAANGTVTVHTFSGAGGVTCSSTPCTLDVNITTAGGTAKYIVVRIVGTL